MDSKKKKEKKGKRESLGKGKPASGSPKKWELNDPQKEEIDDLLEDLDGVLDFTENYFDMKPVEDPKVRSLFSGQTSQSDKKNLKKTLRALSTPAGEAKMGLGGKRITTESRGIPEKSIPMPGTEKATKFGVFPRLLLIVTIPWLCMIILTFLTFSFLTSQVQSLEENRNKVHRQQLEEEMRNSLHYFGSLIRLGSNNNQSKKPGLLKALLKQNPENIASILPANHTLFLWAKERNGMYKLKKSWESTYETGATSLKQKPNPSREKLEKEELLALFKNILAEEGPQNINAKGLKMKWIFTGPEKLLQNNTILGVFRIPSTDYIVGLLNREDKSRESKTFIPIKKAVYKEKQIILLTEVAGYFIIAFLIILYARSITRQTKKLGHHIDMIALGNLDQPIVSDSTDEFAMLTQKLSGMQASFLAAIERLRRRRNL